MKNKTVALALSCILSVSAGAWACGLSKGCGDGVGAPSFFHSVGTPLFTVERRLERPADADGIVDPCLDNAQGDRRSAPPKALRGDPLIEIRFGGTRGTGGMRHLWHLRLPGRTLDGFFFYVPMQITATTVDNAILRPPAASALFPRSPPRRSGSS